MRGGGGGDFLDTANVYTKGHSEKIIGDHIGRHARRRHHLVIATKFFGNMSAGDPNAGGSSRKSIHVSCEESLRRLQTDYIDLYWMHAWDSTTPIDETMRALDDLVRAGKVRYIRFSDTPAWKVAQAQVTAEFRGWIPLVALQIEYSLLERTVEGELIPMAREMGLGVTPWSPLKGGVLSGKYTRENAGQKNPDRGERVTQALDERAYATIDVLSEIAKEIGSTPAQVALKWVQGQPGVASTIIGARTLDQLEDNLAGLNLRLEEEHWKSLAEVSEPQLNFPAAFLQMARNFSYGGATINGQESVPLPQLPQNDEDMY